jgi:hypothetical protein
LSCLPGSGIKKPLTDGRGKPLYANSIFTMPQPAPGCQQKNHTAFFLAHPYKIFYELKTAHKRKEAHE